MSLLTPELLRALRSSSGRELLERALLLEEDSFAAERLRAFAAPEFAAAAVEQVRLRRRAATRFTRAAEMWFLAELLEQASGDDIAEYRAGRFQPWGEDPRGVGDLCCGLGGDALFLAESASVHAVDRDPLAVALSQANAEDLGMAGRIIVSAGELPEAAPNVSAAWVDPGRRAGGRRTRRLEEMSPPISQVLALRQRTPHLGVKLSPATDHAELDACLDTLPHEREAISVRGECRELVLWTGDLRGPHPRRATLLPGRESLTGVPVPLPPLRPPGGWLLEPDAAVIRAGLVGNLAEELSAWPLDPHLAYLWLNAPVATPFGVIYRVEPPEPFSGKALAKRLRDLGASDVILKTRGAAMEPELLRRQLRGVLKQGQPGCCPVVLLTRVSSRAVMIVGERCGAGAGGNR